MRPYDTDEIPKDKNIRPYFEELFAEIRSHNYFPSLPRDYNIADKGNGVPRVIPVFEFKDLAVFYFCCRYLEEGISSGRVDRTFGGYSLGSLLRDKEKEELDVYREEWEEIRAAEMSDFAYFGSGSIRPNIWVEEWKEFQRVSYQIVTENQPRHALKFDISNFYDNIPLDKLETRLRRISSPDHHRVIDLLFVFLRNWNRQHEGYGVKTVGIPQDESGESSRLLANTYLQDYDRWMNSQADKCGAIYLRYADDQILFGNNSQDLSNLMYRAGVFLRRDGLNLNAGKVTQYDDIEDFQYYWSYDWFTELEGNPTPDTVIGVAEKFLERCENGDLNWRWDSLMRRMITLGIPNDGSDTRKRFLKFVLAPKNVVRLTDWHFTRLYKSFSDGERKELFASIDAVAPTIPTNQFHLYLRKFYLNVGLEDRASAVMGEIAQRSLMGAVAD